MRSLRLVALLAIPARLCLHNTGSAFETDALVAGYAALKAPLRVERTPLSETDVAEWLDKG